MTILLGIRAGVAVVLAADGRTSLKAEDGSVETLSDDVVKVVNFPRGSSVAVMFSGRASIWDRPLGELMEDYAERVEASGETVHASRLRVKNVGRAARDYFEELLGEAPIRGNVNFVAVGFSDGSAAPEAYWFSVGRDSEETSIDLAECGFFLKGSPETRSFDPRSSGGSTAEVRLIEGVSSSRGGLDLRSASELASAVIAEASRVFDEVGGKVRMWIVKPGEPLQQLVNPG